MLHFLFILLLLGFVVLVSVILGVLGIFRKLFGAFRRRNPDGEFVNNRSESTTGNRFTQSSGRKKNKVISEQEGEYVDYEEIRE